VKRGGIKEKVRNIPILGSDPYFCISTDATAKYRGLTPIFFVCEANASLDI